MSDEAEPLPPGEAIKLAGSPDFSLGELRVQPSLRRVSAAGREEMVEPRVMQALIALAEAGGTVVSRDALIDRCWGGRIVGEDAINRCIAKVRRLADTAAPPAFSIETIPRVGYLLKATGGTLEQHPPARAPQAVEERLPEGGARQIPGSEPAQDKVTRHRMPGWRETGIIAFVIVLAVTGTVVAWRSAIPVMRPPAASAPFNPPPRSVAVLAFANLSGDPGQDYLADGLSEALIDLLCRVNELRVTARTSSFFFKGKTATIGEIARALNVASVLEGSLRRQGPHLRIDVHLSDARTGFQLWSQSYDRAPDDLLKLQDEIARATAEALRVKLVDTDAEGLNQGGTANPLAFDAYLRAEQHLRAIGDENDDALMDLRRAVALDPNFALAQSRLAFTLLMISQSAPVDDTYRAMMAEARRSADLAVKLAPNLGLTHAQRAIVIRNGVTDMSAAWAEAKAARALTPGNATVLQNFALIARTIGHADEAVQAAQSAVALDPLRNDLWWTLGRVLGCARQYDGAREAFQRSIALLGHAPGFANFEFASLLLRQGKPKAARQMCLGAQGGNGPICLALADHALGRQDEAEAQLAKLQTECGDGCAYENAAIYAQWGQPLRAVQWLQKARATNSPSLWDLKCDPFLDPIRSQAGFREIEDSLHFPPS